jgi:hypothetical protein
MLLDPRPETRLVLLPPQDVLNDHRDTGERFQTVPDTLVDSLVILGNEAAETQWSLIIILYNNIVLRIQ